MYRLNKFMQRTRQETKDMKERWGKVDANDSAEGWSRAEVGMSVLTEEVGKAARAINKINIVRDPAVREAWEKELGYRLVTTASVASRIAEQYAREGYTE